MRRSFPTRKISFSIQRYRNSNFHIIFSFSLTLFDIFAGKPLGWVIKLRLYLQSCIMWRNHTTTNSISLHFRNLRPSFSWFWPSAIKCSLSQFSSCWTRPRPRSAWKSCLKRLSSKRLHCPRISKTSSSLRKRSALRPQERGCSGLGKIGPI